MRYTIIYERPETIPAHTILEDTTCWECGTSVPSGQLVRSQTLFQANLCAPCEGWRARLMLSHFIDQLEARMEVEPASSLPCAILPLTTTATRRDQ